MGNEAMKIEDICKVSSSKRIFAREYVETGVPFWRGKEVTEHATGKNDSKGLFISAKRYNELKQTGNVPSDDDVLITAVGTIGSIYQIKHEDLPFYFKDGNIIRLSNWNTDRVNPTYVSLFLRSQIGQQAIKEVEIGSTQKALTIKDIAKVPILLPELKTQNDIAAAIGVIDAKIKINQQINKNLLQMMETKWRKQFEGLDANQGHFTDLADVVAGGTPSKKQSEYFGGNIAWITPKDMSKTTRVFIEHGTLNITKIGLNNSSAKLIPKGTILFSSRAPIGYIGIAANPVSTNQGFKSLVPKRKEFTEYLYFLLKRLTPLIENIASGSTFKEISGAGMKSVDFPLPTSDMIEAFHHEARSLFDLIKCNEKQSQYLNFIRNLILPKLLAGEINISFIEEAIKNA
ncbi:restriction endonuclease subunit S [Secundilactobacillus paracollinoides]|uniref:restriction endonuclease subunit S n=1 Tax=Secundilactobacillus paracollinoides TaxID=240427 RepID=UPI0009F5A37B|nr:restriction endonuclease subunit S [Secundilactobacillus paracollinoides]